VLAGLVDRDPDVAADCASLGSRTHLLQVYDRMVACLGDERENRAGQTVGDRNRFALMFSIQLELTSRHVGDYDTARVFEGPPRDGEAFRPILTGGREIPKTADEVRAWWRANREQFAFAKPSPPLRVVFDDVIELRLDEAHGIQLRTGERFDVTLTEHTEFVSRRPPGEA
jgi:hypothetical protein